MKRTTATTALPAVLVFLSFALGMSVFADDAPASPPDVEGEAMFKVFVPPAYPEAALKAKRDGRVDLDFIVDEAGNVTEANVVSSTDNMFEEPAIAAVRQWKFEPAVSGGKPIAMGMTGPVVFSIARQKNKKPSLGMPPMDEWPHASPRVRARVVSAPDPDYPEELASSKLPGQVNLELKLDAEGHIEARRVLWASHAAFVEEALRVASLWKFAPAHQGLLAVPATMSAPVTFASLGAKTRDICAANGLHLEDESFVDTWPEPVVMQAPVYPHELLVSGTSGSAQATFTIDERGEPTGFTLGECSAPEFGAALTAAADTWHFRPATKDGSAVAVRVSVRHEFRAPRAGPVARLVSELTHGGIPGAKGLDAPLKIVWRGFPAYPSALHGSGTAGDAEVEFVIDHGGRARLPHVVSATRPEFGWAAMTAVSEWVFVPPERGGQPTDVRVRVPLHFTPNG